MRFWTNKAATLVASAALNLATDTLKVMLFTGQKAGTMASTSNGIVTGLASTTGLVAGMYATGARVGSGAKILTVDSSSQVTLDVNNISTGADTITFHPHEDFDFASQVNGIEAGGTGYAGGFGGGGRKVLDSPRTFTEDDANNRVKIAGVTTKSWSGINVGTLTGYAVLKEITNDAASPLLFYGSDGFPQITNSGTFDLIWDPIGIATFTVTVQ